MKILFVSNDLIAGDVARKLSLEGNEVKLFIQEKGRRDNFENLVVKTNNWKDELKWVSKNGLIIFDDVGYGKHIDKLKKAGYHVFGGGFLGDRLELDREYAQDIFRTSGMKTVELKNFSSIDKAINFVKKNKGQWVIKQNNHAPKGLNYVGHHKDGLDVVDVLESYKKHSKEFIKVVSLQKRIIGVEVAVARYFNGHKWLGPIEINIEHKKFLPGDIGITTSEMGTLAWYSSDENLTLFKETLGRLEDHLRKIDYRGVIDINCIANEDGIFPLEATARFGSPIVHLQTSFFNHSITNFIEAVACGKDFASDIKTGYGIVALMAVPPFPYAKKIKGLSFKGQTVYFDNIIDTDWQNIHFEEISYDKKNKKYYISDERGYVMYITGFGKSIKDAQNDLYTRIAKIHIPKSMYRNDLGDRFDKHSMQNLKDWKYI